MATDVCACQMAHTCDCVCERVCGCVRMCASVCVCVIHELSILFRIYANPLSVSLFYTCFILIFSPYGTICVSFSSAGREHQKRTRTSKNRSKLTPAVAKKSQTKVFGLVLVFASDETERFLFRFWEGDMAEDRERNGAGGRKRERRREKEKKSGRKKFSHAIEFVLLPPCERESEGGQERWREGGGDRERGGRAGEKNLSFFFFFAREREGGRERGRKGGKGETDETKPRGR